MSLDDLLDLYDPRIPKNYLSVSQLRDFLTCRAFYHFKHTLRLPPDKPLPLRLARGRAGHRTAEFALLQKMQEKTTSLDEMKDFFSSVYEQEAETCTPSEDEDPGKTKDQGIQMIQVLAEQVLPSIEPVMLEQKIETEVGGVPFVMVLDVVTPEGVRDFKFSGRSPDSDEAQKSHQLTAYAIGYEILRGKPPAMVGLDHIVALKTQTKYVQQVSNRTKEQKERFARTVAAVKRDIDNQIIYPNDGNWKCAMCEYKETCRKTF